MSLRTSAKRYARALFDVALQEGADLSRVDRDLAAVVDVAHACADDLRVAMRHQVPAEIRGRVVEAIAQGLDVCAPVRKLLVLLAAGRRLALLPELAAAYRARLLDHQNIVRADVTTAVALSPARAQALSARLSQVTGKQVDMTMAVDAELLGGLVARIGSTVYDGSVRTQLKKLRQALTE